MELTAESVSTLISTEGGQPNVEDTSIMQIPLDTITCMIVVRKLPAGLSKAPLQCQSKCLAERTGSEKLSVPPALMLQERASARASRRPMPLPQGPRWRSNLGFREHYC